MNGSGRNTVVLDRDGTIVIDRHYLDDPAQLAFLPGAATALRWLHENGYRLVVVTNQSGVGRGLFSVQRLEEIHQRLKELVTSVGSKLDGIYYCPHTPADGCRCRKPQTGLLETAAQELSFDPSSVIVVGDKPCDVELGNRIGAPTILIGDAQAATECTPRPSFVAHDMREAARFIAQLNRQRRSDAVTLD